MIFHSVRLGMGGSYLGCVHVWPYDDWSLLDDFGEEQNPSMYSMGIEKEKYLYAKVCHLNN